MKRYLLGLLLLFAIPAVVQAQSVPNQAAAPIQQGVVWTPQQWIAAWQSKADASGGTFTNPTITGGTTSSTADAASVTATGATTSRTLADWEGDFVRATAFGAKFDGVRLSSGGSMSSGSATFNWSGGSFTSADIGKLISVDGAGVNGRPLNTTISGVISSTQATLAAIAASTVPTSIWNPSGTWAISAAGSGYAPGDQITLTGGTSSYSTVLLVVATQVVSGTVVSGGSGGTTGACTVTGTTGLQNGTSTAFQLSGTVSGGALSGALTVAVAGMYRDNPTTITNEPVTGCGLTGATVSVAMGANEVISVWPGAYSVRPSDPVAQGSTTGSGSGVTFTGAWASTGTFFYGTDNTTAIQAAINYCQGHVVNFAGGCQVSLPIGTGLISGGLTINKQLVALNSLSRSSAFSQRNVTGPNSQTYPTRLFYAGTDNPGYLLTQVPLLADGKRLYGVDVQGIMFDCNGTPGCGGVYMRSTAQSVYKAAVSEPYPRAYTTVGATTAGSSTVTVTDATGIDVGETFWSPNVLAGTYVASISGNTLTLSSQAYGGGVVSGAAVWLGGEGWRVDVLGGLNPNDTQQNDYYIQSRNLNTISPSLAIGGSSPAGSPEYGNTSANRFWNVGCYSYVADCVDANNSDHNYWFGISGLFVPNTTTVGGGFISNGSLDANNGANRYNWFFGGPTRRAAVFRGTSQGGFTNASFANSIQWSITSAAPVTVVDTAGGAQLCISNDNQPAIGCIGTQALQANAADSTTVGGNSRGANAVDLQSSRTTATQVATGTTSTIGGGANNSATNTGATVVGGSGVTASGINSVAGGSSVTASGAQSTAFGSATTASGQTSFAVGNSNTASGSGSVALGQSATASHPYQFCMSNGVITAGKAGSSCEEHLRGTGASASAIRVTADGAAAGASNCVNIGLDHAATFIIQLQVYDRTTPTVANWLSYYEPQGVMWIGNTNGTTAYTASGSAVTKTAGTMSTATVSATADTTNGCLNLSFTPPGGNTDTLDVFATVNTTNVN